MHSSRKAYGVIINWKIAMILTFRPWIINFNSTYTTHDTVIWMVQYCPKKLLLRQNWLQLNRKCLKFIVSYSPFRFCPLAEKPSKMLDNFLVDFLPTFYQKVKNYVWLSKRHSLATTIDLGYWSTRSRDTDPQDTGILTHKIKNEFGILIHGFFFGHFAKVAFFSAGR